MYKSTIEEYIIDTAPADYNKTDKLKTNCLLLERLYQINESSDIIKYDQFYLKGLTTDGTNLFEDYKNWRFPEGQSGNPQINLQTPPVNQTRFSFCNFPFVYDAQAKATLLKGNSQTHWSALTPLSS